MPQAKRKKNAFRVFRKIMIFAAVAASAMAVMLAVFLLLLPRLLSGPSGAWVRTRICETAGEALHRPVRLDGLAFTWADGLTVTGFRVAEDPAFAETDLLVLDRANVNAGVPDLFPPRVSATVRVEGIRARFIRNAEGRTNLEALLALLKGEDGLDAPPKAGPPPRIPVELTADIRVRGIELTARDDQTGRRLLLSEGRFDLSIPRLRSETATLTMASNLRLEDRDLPPLTFSLKAGNLFSEDGRPDPMRASAEIQADLPGTRLDGRIDMRTFENSMNLNCDVAALMEAAKPLLSETAAPAEAAGVIDLAFHTSGDPMADVSFETTCTGTDLKMSGGPLGSGSAGPFRFQMFQNGVYLPGEEKMTIRTGEFSFSDHTRLSWNGEIRDLLKPEKQVDLAMQSIFLDIKELTDAARPFLPEGMSLGFVDPGSSSSLTVDSANLAGTVPSGSQKVTMKGLSLNMRGLHAASGGIRMADAELDFTMPKFSASLTRFFPDGVEFDAALDLKRLTLEEPLRADIAGVSVPLLSLTAAGMSALQPLPDQVKMEASLGIENVRLPDSDLAATGLGVPKFGLTMDRLREVSLSTTVQLENLRMGGDAPVSLENLVLSDLALRLNHPDLPSLLSGRPSASDKNGAQTGAVSRAESAVQPSPAGTFVLDGALSFDALRLGGDTPVTLGKFSVPRFQVTGDRISLPEMVPRKAGIVAEVSLDRLEVAGAQPAVLEGLQLPEVRVSLEEMALSPRSRFGVSGRITLDQSMRLALAQIPELVSCRDLSQSLRMEGRLTEAGLALRETAFSVAEASVDAPPYGVFPVGMNAEAARIDLTMDPLSADLEALRIKASVAPMLTLEAVVDATRSGAGSLGTRGKMNLDAGRLPEGLRKLLPPGMRVTGATVLDCLYSGRLPSAAEIEALRDAPKFDVQKDLPFVDILDLGVAMDRLALSLERAGSPPIAVDRMDTSEPLRYRYEGESRRGKLTGSLTLAGVRNVAPMKEPLNMTVSIDVVHEGFQELRLSQKMEIPLLHLDESLQISLSGLHRMLRSAPMASGWPKLNGKIRASLDSRQLPQLVPDMAVQGGLACGLELDLEAQKRVRGLCWARSENLDVAMKDLADVKGITVDLNLEKTYAIASGDTANRRAVPLSAEVLSSPLQGMNSDDMPAFLRKRISIRPTLSFQTALVRAGPAPFEASRGAATFLLNRGLPVLEPFQADVLGGTVMGAAAAFRSEEGIGVEAGAAFTGIDPDVLLAPDVRGRDADREINGRFRVKAPLSTDIRHVLRKMNADVHLSRIGSRSLERFLYALDPYESDETIASQRRLLRSGTPRWVRVGMANGGLSLTGEVDVKGVRIAIPELNRLNVTNLPGLSEYGRSLSRLEPIIRILEIMASDRIQVDQNGNISIGENG